MTSTIRLGTSDKSNFKAAYDDINALIDRVTALEVPEIINYTSGIIAHPGGTQTGAVPITTAINRVDTVASANDSVLLPAASSNKQIWIFNRGANTLAVYANGSDVAVGGTTDGFGNSLFSHPSLNLAIVTTFGDGSWYINITPLLG